MLLTPEKIKELLPVDDGYSYYQAFGEAVAKAQLTKTLQPVEDMREAILDRVEHGCLELCELNIACNGECASCTTNQILPLIASKIQEERGGGLQKGVYTWQVDRYYLTQ